VALVRSWFPARPESDSRFTQGLRPGLLYSAPSGLGLCAVFCGGEGGSQGGEFGSGGECPALQGFIASPTSRKSRDVGHPVVAYRDLTVIWICGVGLFSKAGWGVS
jgi:hypothetical protein